MLDILIVVDMQNDFITGSLGTKEAQKIVNNVALEINKSYDMVFFTQDTHDKNYLNTQEGKNLPIEHCIDGEDGWKLHDDIKLSMKAARCPVYTIKKNIFGSYNLLEKLEYMSDKINSITIVGLCTDICVISNALIIKSKFPEIKLKCIENCCAGVTPEKHNAAIEVMKSCQVEVL